MLAANALKRLTTDLASAIEMMEIRPGSFGKSQLVDKSTKEAERIFQGYAKGKPSKEDAYAVAREFLQGRKLGSWQRDIIASAIAEPIRELSGAMVISDKRFDSLLAVYDAEAKRGDLWRLTWYGLLQSYFSFDPCARMAGESLEGWSRLREFLERTWPLIDGQVGTGLLPDWVKVLREEFNVLSEGPSDKYARDYLRGDTSGVNQLATDLGIPRSSWFWHSLVLGAVKRAAEEGDVEFRQLVPQLLKFIESNPGFRDESVELILVRYHACKGTPPDERLRDFVCRSDVWKNPKLKAAGIATAWNRVPDPVWHMVLSWVNERNLKDFFDILAARNKADEGRLEFWSNYLKQISWTRLIFGVDTMALKRTNAEIRDLIAREEGAYAQLTDKPKVDAFMMQIGSYLIIEFSKKPNACYVYQSDQLPFEPYARSYSGGSSDLAIGFGGECAARIVHTPGWQARAADELKRLGIRPDQSTSKSDSLAPRSGLRKSPQGSLAGRRGSPAGPVRPDMRKVASLVARFPGALILDERTPPNVGRLWVTDPRQRVVLGDELKSLGFKWANSRNAWYYAGS